MYGSICKTYGQLFLTTGSEIYQVMIFGGCKWIIFSLKKVNKAETSWKVCYRGGQQFNAGTGWCQLDCWRAFNAFAFVQCSEKGECATDLKSWQNGNRYVIILFHGEKIIKKKLQ